MTSFERDMGEMVREAAASDAKKSLAMNYVRATGRIANGSRGNPEAICDAMIAQTPIMLEMYLEPRVTKRDIAAAVSTHLADCPAGKILLRKREGTDPGTSDGSFNWQRFLFSVGEKLTWPGAFVIVFGMIREPLVQVLFALAEKLST